MNCLYCDKKINRYSIYSLLYETDMLCIDCREKMKFNYQTFTKDGLTIESFYEYDSLFKDILLQYKECYDEALKDIFLYKIEDYLKIKYHNYKILYCPSTAMKLQERGFNHLKGIFERLNLEEVNGLKIKQEINQTGKNYNERAKIIDNFIYVGEHIDKLLIVDDVYTSGSTVSGVYKAIKGKCVKNVKAVVLAKTL